ncbi:tyrosine-protein phosphatase [Spiractinospora alimapuensis]|uniref:protein-tyrosine phosphatase family protein n=1 Tax=Spiractinospora alimapuensis TaxID=2820884 RepID=UPI001F4297F9|nr:tyrosine-protein phosphatase [Spiractinospora alimapuensis]QVQ50905.1 tyrosine-protein phosphatase [Spiractinospora alimapuensis]
MVRALTLDFVAIGVGTIAVSHRPRVKSLPAMRSLGATHLVSLLSTREGAREIGAAARAAGLEWVWVELANGDVPPPARDHELASALSGLTQILREGAGVVVHCSAGIHRTGMFSYALLRATGLGPEDAIATLRRSRVTTADGVGEHRLSWGDRLSVTMGWAAR